MRASRVSPFALVLLSLACNKAPSAPGILIDPVEPGTADDLVVTFTSESEDPNSKDTVNYTYTWYQDGLERTDMSSDTIAAALTAKGELWEVIVTPSDGKVDGEPGSASVAIANSAPSASVELSPDAPLATDALEATASGSDPDDDAVTFAYSWTVDGVATAHAGDTVPAVDTARGEVWEVTVIPNDGQDLGEPVSASVNIDNTAPSLDLVELGPEPAYEYTTLEVAFEAVDDDGDEVTASYAFYVDDALAQDSTDPTIDGGLFDKGQQVYAVVTPTDGFIDGEPATTNTVEILNSAPLYASVTLDPTEVYEDSTVSCIPSGWSDADGDAEGYSLTWYVDGVAITADPTITGELFDRGDELYCEVLPDDGEDTGEPVASEVVTVSNSVPSVASASLSTTSPTVADTLTVNVTDAVDADGDSITLSYSWLVDGIAVSNLPSLAGSYFTKGSTIAVEVTPSDGRDSGATVTSDTATAVNSPPAVSSLLLSPTSLYTDSELTASLVTSDADGDRVSVSYAWSVDGSVVSTAGSSLDGDSWFDKGQVVSVTVTPNDGEDDGTPATASGLTVQNTPPEAPTVTISPTEPVGGVDDLVCEVLVDSTDADADSVTYSFGWMVNGSIYTGLHFDDASSSTVAAIDTDDAQTWICSATPNDGDDNGPAGTAAVDIGDGGGEDPCLWPDNDVVASTGPASGSTITPYYFSVSFIGTIHSDLVYDWENSSGEQPAYIEFEFYDSSASSICSVYYDMDSATAATGWTTSSGGALYGAFDVPLAGGYTTCPPISYATWGTTDVRDLIEDWSWGFGVGELVDVATDLRTAVLDAGLDWLGDWAPYVSAQYVYSDLYGQAYELGWVWGWEDDCGELVTDSSGDTINLSSPTASPLDDGVWDGSGFYLFYASAFAP